MRRIIILMNALVLCAAAVAQNNERDAVVNVENDYNPVVIEVNKKNFTPSTQRATDAKPIKIVYSTEGMPYGSFDGESEAEDVMPVKQKEFPGYARLGYGTTNDLDAKVAYRVELGKKKQGTLRVAGALDGFKSEVDGWFNDWNSRLFTTAVDAGYTHKFKKLELDIDGKFKNDVFNYQSSGEKFFSTLTDKQNSRRYSLELGGVSKLTGPASYWFNVGTGYTGRSHLSGSNTGFGETTISAGTGFGLEIYDTWLHSLGLDVNVEAFHYTSALRKAELGYGDQMSIDIDPYLNFNVGKWSLKLATKMNFMTEGTLFAIAPDVEFKGHVMENVALFAKVGGGRTHNGLATLDGMTPYWSIDTNKSKSLEPTYRIADASVGTRISFEPLSIDLIAGYAYTKDDLLQVLGEQADGRWSLLYADFKQDNTHNAYITTRLGLDIRSWMKLSADARYDLWECKDNELLVMKPEITVNVDAEARVAEHLTLRVGYNFTRYTKSGENGRINNKYDLNARLSYRFGKRIGAYIEGNNLLGSNYLEYAGYYTRGARGSLGVTMNF